MESKARAISIFGVLLGFENG